LGTLARSGNPRGIPPLRDGKLRRLSVRMGAPDFFQGSYTAEIARLRMALSPGRISNGSVVRLELAEERAGGREPSVNADQDDLLGGQSLRGINHIFSVVAGLIQGAGQS
jgi:hypothetical protein